MNKQLGLLFVVAILAGGGGVWLTLDTQPDSPMAEKLFSPGVSQADKITEITLQTTQNVLLQANLANGKWMAKVPDGYNTYPIDKSKLGYFLQEIVQAKLAEAKTTKQQNYHYLGVESIDNMDSLATLVSFNMDDAPKQWQMLVGNKANMGEGTYVRSPTSPQTWLIDRVIELPNDPYEWLQRPILSLKSSEIESVSRTDGKPWTMSRVSEDDYSLGVLPKGRTLRYPSIVSAYVDNILALDFEQVLPLDLAAWKKAKPVANLELKLTQDNKLTLKLASLDKEYYLQFSSQTVAGYYLDWTYKISFYSAQQLLKSKEDFLAELDNNLPIKAVDQDMDEGESPQ